MTTTAVKERPILMSAPMVRAILEGRKTQTRRVIQWKVREPGLNLRFSGLEAGFYCSDLESSGWVLRSRGGASGCWNDRTWPIHCPYGKTGDRLWVRETWTAERMKREVLVVYRASCNGDDFVFPHKGVPVPCTVKRWKPSIFMPREVSRIDLEVTNIRVERLQSMTHLDWRADFAPSLNEVNSALETFKGDDNRREMSRTFWDSINAARGFSWDSNPWVWVISFKRIQP